MFRITGVDLVAVAGLSASMAQTLLTEIGTDMSMFPTHQHFAAWLGLAPPPDISGGKVLPPVPSKLAIERVSFSAKPPLPSLAPTPPWRLLPSQTRSTRPQQAIVATAHKIARTVYAMLKNRSPYQDVGAEAYEAKYRQQELNYLKRKAAKLGFDLTPQDLALVPTAT